jgi:putative endonuclease
LPTPLGISGEEIAEDHLRSLGYAILGRDVRTPIGQLDLVARDGPTLVFVEVKTRTGTGFGLPQEAVGRHKQRKLRQLAMCYLKRHPHQGPLRFDVVGILMDSGQVGSLSHLKNALT